MAHAVQSTTSPVREQGYEETTHEIAILEKDCQRIEYRGLTLAEAKQILSLPKIRKRRSC